MKTVFIWQGNPTPVTITKNLDLPGDERFADISLQLLESMDVAIQVVGIYQEGHSFGADDGVITHRVYMVEQPQFDDLKKLMDQLGDQTKISSDHPQFEQIRKQYESLRTVQPSYTLLKEADYEGVPEYWP